MWNLILIAVVAVALAVFLIFATKKRWISWKGSSGIATLTAYHDLQPQDKQHAIEIVMEQKAGKKMEEQESGQGKESEPTSRRVESST